MISLLRKIRQKLLEEKKIGSYLKYAIGEILLVVIGILIALQVNNWKEERGNRMTEINFYRAVLDDLEKDRTKISQLNEFYNHRIEVLTWLLARVRDPEIPVDPIDFGRNIEPLYYNESAISFDATFDAAKSSGVFYQFDNKVLLRQMTQYYSEFKQIDDVITSTLRLIEKELEPLLATVPKNYLSDSSSTFVIAEGGNKYFYELLGDIKDRRNIDADPEIRSFFQKPDFESYLIGDLGRAFHSTARLNSRLELIDSLETEINIFLND